MACRSDMDCIYGTRRCIGNICEAISGDSSVCISDFDCDVGFYCPVDPTAGEDPYYVQYCKAQLADGDVCSHDTDCLGTLRCNVDGTCTALFSKDVGELVSESTLCKSGQVGLDGHCVEAFVSTRLAQPCESDADCGTTDVSGSLSACACRNWWEDGAVACKKCIPVFGDFQNQAERIRTYLYQKGIECGSIWSVSDCHREKPQIEKLYFAYKCEEQRLAGGLVTVPKQCEDDTYLDYCSLVIS